MMKEYLNITNRKEFRKWLMENSQTEKECWISCRRGRPSNEDELFYLDAVEEALCFGWIDSTNKIVDGVRLQRFSPRQKNGYWTELNKERVRRLEKLGLMRDEGRKVLPKMGKRSFKIDERVVRDLKRAKVYSKFMKLPPLYIRVRAYNLYFYLDKKMIDAYQKSLSNLIKATKEGKLIGEWNDYGRLLDY